MQSNLSGPDEPQPPPVETPSPQGQSGASDADDELIGARVRLHRLAKVLRKDCIPEFARSGREVSAMLSDLPDADDIEAFADALLEGDEDAIESLLSRWRGRGLSTESLFLDLFAPAARHFGELWDEDCVDPARVTIGVGRLQRLMRQLGPGFASEADVPPKGRRVVLAHHPSEQHVFGLSMLAEFFRRDGWEVVGGPTGTPAELEQRVSSQWIDVVGLSLGGEVFLPWLRSTIGAMRAASRNPSIIVMVGGPLFTLHPHWVHEVDADATADAATAPRLAEKMLGVPRGSVRGASASGLSPSPRG